MGWYKEGDSWVYPQVAHGVVGDHYKIPGVPDFSRHLRTAQNILNRLGKRGWTYMVDGAWSPSYNLWMVGVRLNLHDKDDNRLGYGYGQEANESLEVAEIGAILMATCNAIEKSPHLFPEVNDANDSPGGPPPV